MQLYTKILLGMLIGVVLGFLVGPNSALLPETGVRLTSQATLYSQADTASAPAALSLGVRSAEILELQSGDPPWAHVQWKLKATDLIKMQKK